MLVIACPVCGTTKVEKTGGQIVELECGTRITACIVPSRNNKLIRTQDGHSYYNWDKRNPYDEIDPIEIK